MEVFLNIYIGILVFVMGTLFGSFFSLATYRLPRREDILVTRSYCPNCKHKLGFLDLIPVLSFAFLGAKCRYCKIKISPRYFLLEIINGCIFLGLYLIFGYTIKLLSLCLVYAIMFVLIGSQVMRSRMSDEEKEEVTRNIEKRKKEKLEKKSMKKNYVENVDNSKSKAGVYVAELVIAMAIFIILFSSAIVVTRNYNNKIKSLVVKNNATNIAVRNMELALATDYNVLNSKTLIEKIDGIDYTVSLNVKKYSDMDMTKEDLVKIITVTVKYSYDNKIDTYELKTLKGKVI